jgi:hypothetical protein
MNIINNLEWYFGEPKYARNMKEKTTITKEELETIVFDDNIDKNVKFCFPLNDSFTFYQIRELHRPITVEKLLTFIHNFYSQQLTKEIVDKAFENNAKMKKDFLENFEDGDISGLTYYDIFDDTCTPDFCGIYLIEDSTENNGAYFVNIGPI